MTKFLGVVVVVALTGLPTAQGQVVGSFLPRDTLQDLSGSEASLYTEYAGRTVLLKFFAYW